MAAALPWKVTVPVPSAPPVIVSPAVVASVSVPFATASVTSRLPASTSATDKALPPAVENTSAVSVALARQMMWKMLGADHPREAHRVDSRLIYAMGRSPDGYEGVSSFLEKRPARFGMKVSKDLPDFFPWWREG